MKNANRLYILTPAIALAVIGTAGCQGEKPQWSTKPPAAQQASIDQARQAIENNPNLSPEMKQRMMGSGFGPAAPPTKR